MTTLLEVLDTAALVKLSVPERIEAVRRAAGSHDKLAALLGTHRQVIIRWERGTRPSAVSRRRLAEVTGLPEDYFDATAERAAA